MELEPVFVHKNGIDGNFRMVWADSFHSYRNNRKEYFGADLEEDESYNYNTEGNINGAMACIIEYADIYALVHFLFNTYNRQSSDSKTIAQQALLLVNEQIVKICNAIGVFKTINPTNVVPIRVWEDKLKSLRDIKMFVEFLSK